MSNPLDNLEPENNRPSPILTDELKLKILKRWQDSYENPPSIEELCDLCWPGWKFDGRSKHGRVIKEYLISQNLEAKTKTVYEPKEILELNDSQKEFIRNNLNLKNHEMAQILYEKQYLTATSNEARSVGLYREELRKQGIIKNDNGEEVTEKYSPPKTLDRVCARINRNIEGANFDFKNLTPTQKKQALSLINYLHNTRFINHMDLITNFEDRKILENTYLKYIYDKPDLSQEDLDQYLLYANESVMECSIKRTIAMLEREQERSLNEDGKISMTVVESLTTSRKELSDCIGRQGKLYKSLTEERSQRLREKINENASVLNLVEAWINKVERDKIINMANQRKEKLGTEIDKLENMDELKVRILGIGKNEILEG